MRILRLTTVYAAYVRAFYAERPGLEAKTYEEQKAALDHDAFAWADFWPHHLRPLGYEGLDVHANVEPLQHAWAREHGFPSVDTASMFEIAQAQIQAFRPDILFLDDHTTFTADYIQAVRAACPSIKLTLGWCGAPFTDARVFGAYDVVLSCIPELVEQFRAMGHQAQHVNHAFEPRLLDRLGPPPAPDLDFSFVGNIVRGNQYHLQRERLLEQLVGLGAVRIFAPSATTTRSEDLRAIARRIGYEGVQLARAVGVPERTLARLPVLGKVTTWQSAPMRPVNPRLRPHMSPGVFGLTMYQTLRRSKATFNSHIDVSRASASNMRLFEATGVGTCLVTDWKENLHELFEPDREVVTYRNPQECIEKVQWLIAHPEEREAIAQRGQARTLRDHAFPNRARQLDQLIRQHLP